MTRSRLSSIGRNNEKKNVHTENGSSRSASHLACYETADSTAQVHFGRVRADKTVEERVEAAVDVRLSKYEGQGFTADRRHQKKGVHAGSSSLGLRLA